jgi:hypothetical protein
MTSPPYEGSPRSRISGYVEQFFTGEKSNRQEVWTDDDLKTRKERAFRD